MMSRDTCLHAADSFLTDIKIGRSSPEVEEINQRLKSLPYGFCKFRFNQELQKYSGARHVLVNKSHHVPHLAFLLNPDDMNRVYNLGKKYQDYEWFVAHDGKRSNWQLRKIKTKVVTRSRILPTTNLSSDTAVTLSRSFTITLIDEPEELNPADVEFDLGDDDEKFLRPVIVTLDRAPKIKFSPKLPTYYAVNRIPLPASLSIYPNFSTCAAIAKPIPHIKYKKMGGRYNCVFPEMSDIEATKKNINAACQIFRRNNPITVQELENKWRLQT
jgi:hypothetical protein